MILAQMLDYWDEPMFRGLSPFQCLPHTWLVLHYTNLKTIMALL